MPYIKPDTARIDLEAFTGTQESNRQERLVAKYQRPEQDSLKPKD